jgi:hypothetical protein
MVKVFYRQSSHVNIKWNSPAAQPDSILYVPEWPSLTFCSFQHKLQYGYKPKGPTNSEKPHQTSRFSLKKKRFFLFTSPHCEAETSEKQNEVFVKVTFESSST